MFNDGGILEKAARGELTIKLLSKSHPSPPLANEPICTESQMIGYYQGQLKIAEAHQYLRPDQTIGLSGKPDPKQILHEGTVYFLDA